MRPLRTPTTAHGAPRHGRGQPPDTRSDALKGSGSGATSAPAPTSTICAPWTGPPTRSPTAPRTPSTPVPCARPPPVPWSAASTPAGSTSSRTAPTRTRQREAGPRRGHRRRRGDRGGTPRRGPPPAAVPHHGTRRRHGRTGRRQPRPRPAGDPPHRPRHRHRQAGELRVMPHLRHRVPGRRRLPDRRHEVPEDHAATARGHVPLPLQAGGRTQSSRRCEAQPRVPLHRLLLRYPRHRRARADLTPGQGHAGPSLPGVVPRDTQSHRTSRTRKRTKSANEWRQGDMRGPDCRRQ